MVYFISYTVHMNIFRLKKWEGNLLESFCDPLKWKGGILSDFSARSQSPSSKITMFFKQTIFYNCTPPKGLEPTDHSNFIYLWQNLCTTTKIRMQPKSLSMKNRQRQHKIKAMKYSALTKEILPFSTTLVKLKNIISSETNQPQKDKHCIS